MPKQKTHSGTKKRIKVTGSGKLMRERTNKRHLLEVKSSRRTRRLSVPRSSRPPTPSASRSCSASDRPPTSIAGPVRPVHPAGEHPWHA